jgi:hypothetical protein
MRENEDGVTGTTVCEACDRAHGSGRAVALRPFHECAMSDEVYRAVGKGMKQTRRGRPTNKSKSEVRALDAEVSDETFWSLVKKSQIRPSEEPSFDRVELFSGDDQMTLRRIRRRRTLRTRRIIPPNSRAAHLVNKCSIGTTRSVRLAHTVKRSITRREKSAQKRAFASVVDSRKRKTDPATSRSRVPYPREHDKTRIHTGTFTAPIRAPIHFSTHLG